MHAKIADSAICLAEVLYCLDRAAEAHSLHERALTIREKAFGPESTEVAVSLIQLADTLDKLGRESETLTLRQRAVAIREKAHGPDHLDTAASLYGLAATHYNLGRYVESLASYRRALAIYEGTLGLEHPTVSECLDRLECVLRAQGCYPEAVALRERNLVVRRKLASENAGVTRFEQSLAISLDKLGVALCRSGRQEEAEEPQREALALLEKLVLGHPAELQYQDSLATQWYNLACTLALVAGVPQAGGKQDEGLEGRAVDCLRHATRHGFKNVSHMSGDTDLDALRHRTDFRDLLSSLQASGRDDTPPTLSADKPPLADGHCD